MGIFGTIIGNGMGAARDSAARAENYYYGELAAENADKRTRALYEDFQSPEALMRQYKEAGLSPSLMFGGGGGVGGATSQGAQGTGPTGISPTTYGFSGLEEAQIALTLAQAKKTKAETETITGENERGAAEIAKNWAEVGATDAAEKLTRAESTLKQIEVYIAEETKGFNIERCKYDTEKAMDNARQAYWEAEDANLTFKYNLETFAPRVEKASKEIAELASRIALEKSKVALNDAEKNAIADYVKQGYEEAAAKSKNAEEYRKYVEAYTENLPKQLELRAKEIGLEKWKIGVDAFNNLVRTFGYVAGATQLGDGGYTDEETEITQEGNKHVEKTTSKKHVKLPKKMPRIR